MGEVRYRFKQHITRALEYEEGALYEWIRAVWRNNQAVECHTLQSGSIPKDLELYERYWIDQFGGLVNVRRNNENKNNTEIGDRVKRILLHELND